jgi:hypothetical protein
MRAIVIFDSGKVKIRAAMRYGELSKLAVVPEHSGDEKDERYNPGCHANNYLATHPNNRHRKCFRDANDGPSTCIRLPGLGL